MDRISKLPPTITENILCLVPIQEAARTSVLSKEWRHLWTQIPKLVFDEDSFQVSSYGDEPSALEETFDNVQSQRRGMTKRCKLFYAIYQVLLKHEGRIDEFSLSMRPDKTCVEIDHILCYLARNNAVKNLKLDLCGEYRLPLSFYSFNHLTDLHLHWCDLDRQPTYFNGFHKLTNLILENVAITRGMLLHLLSSCPLLKSLNVHTDDIKGTGDSTITNLFECFSMVENLSIWFTTLKCFVQGGVPHVLPTSLIHLKYLHIDYMDIEEEKYGLPILLLLIRSSPNLEKLKLQVERDIPCSSTLEEDYSNIWLRHLKVLEISNMSSEKLELDFVKLILAKSPLLNMVRISFWKDIDADDELHIFRNYFIVPTCITNFKVYCWRRLLRFKLLQ